MSKVQSPLWLPIRTFLARARRIVVQPLMIISIVVTIPGCFVVGPDYKTPDIATPTEWSQGLRRGLSVAEPEAETLAHWWTTLGDPDLSNLIERAIAGNLDLKKAQARIREGRARRGIAEAGLFPRRCRIRHPPRALSNRL
ncbi:MAG: outer membrane protein [Deltaproteobacteria bacterium]|nr:outer membrane protein [Deltaproteobacteria bacterium]